MNKNERLTNDECRFGEMVDFEIRRTNDGGQPVDFDICANDAESVSGTGEAEEELEEESREDHIEAPEQDPGDIRRMKKIIDPCLPIHPVRKTTCSMDSHAFNCFCNL